MLRSEVSTHKLTWGSDCDMAHMSRELSNWTQAFNDIGLSADEQDQIFWVGRPHLRSRRDLDYVRQSRTSGEPGRPWLDTRSICFGAPLTGNSFFRYIA